MISLLASVGASLILDDIINIIKEATNKPKPKIVVNNKKVQPSTKSKPKLKVIKGGLENGRSKKD